MQLENIIGKHSGWNIICLMKRDRLQNLQVSCSWVALRNVILACVLSSVLPGCFFGDSFAVKTVSLKFPTQTTQNHVTLSASEPEVQEVLRLIDEVMASHGFQNYPHLVSAQDHAGEFSPSTVSAEFLSKTASWILVLSKHTGDIPR